MGTKKKLLFVFNPFSGKAQIKNQLLDIVDVMVKADYEVTIYPDRLFILRRARRMRSIRRRVRKRRNWSCAAAGTVHWMKW